LIGRRERLPAFVRGCPIGVTQPKKEGEIWMKHIVFAAALMLGTAAVAQNATQDDTTTDPATATEAPAPEPAPAPAQTTSPSTAPGQTVAPGNQAPERDARGIAVVSDPAQAPAGANQPVSAPPGAQVVVSSNQQAAFQTQPATKEYPPCTKGVTDGCVQTYERGRRPQ
jgi:hypothetical protein